MYIVNLSDSAEGCRLRSLIFVVNLVRQKVLTHHPDKQTAEAQQSEGDDLFKCIKIGTAQTII